MKLAFEGYIRVAGKKGYCKTHMGDAVKHTVSLGSATTGRGYIIFDTKVNCIEEGKA
jgi:hypothetical protein